MSGDNKKTIAVTAAAAIALVVSAGQAADNPAVDWRKFPLWGSTWIVADGINQRIYPSVLPFTPNTVMKIAFNKEDSSVVINWAKLNWRDWGCTADAVDYVLSCLKNPNDGDNRITIIKNTIRDTVPDTSISMNGNKINGGAVVYWQVHAYPRVHFYPRKKSDGTPLMTGTPVGFAEAQQRKQNSFAVADSAKQYADSNGTYQDWRNPYFRDSSSVIISFGFLWKNGDSLGGTSRLTLNNDSVSPVSFTHSPGKMLRVKDNSYRNGYSDTTALYMLYTRDDRSEILAETLDDRCEGWREIDRKNKDLIFYDTASIYNFKRDWRQNDGIFMYNNCPCTYENIRGVSKTKVEARQYIYKPIPTCSYSDMINAYDYYNNLINYLDDPVDTMITSKKITLLYEAIKYRDAIYRSSGVRDRGIFLQREKKCPATWISKISGR